jgi:hypothetical protein
MSNNFFDIVLSFIMNNDEKIEHELFTINIFQKVALTYLRNAPPPKSPSSALHIVPPTPRAPFPGIPIPPLPPRAPRPSNP